MQGQYDIVIVGAGPAGATFARLAGEGHRILLLDGADRGKPCGGLLSPDAQKALTRFNLTLPKEILVDPQIFAVRTIDLRTGRQRYYQRMYLNLDREKFDHWLVSLIPERVDVVRGRCTGVQREDGWFRLTYMDEQGVRRQVRAARLVGADGAASIVRRTFFPKVRIRRYTAIQQWFHAEDENPFYSCIFDPETSDCCSWSIHKDAYLIFGGAFAAKNSRRNFERQKEKLRTFGFNFGTPIRTEACVVLRPNSMRSFCCGGMGVFLIGEAAGLISPSSLEGISSAINSAVALAASLGEDLPDSHARYRRKTWKLRLKLFLKNMKCPFMYNPLLRKLVMASGLSSVDMYARGGK